MKRDGTGPDDVGEGRVCEGVWVAKRSDAEGVWKHAFLGDGWRCGRGRGRGGAEKSRYMLVYSLPRSEDDLGPGDKV